MIEYAASRCIDYSLISNITWRKCESSELNCTQAFYQDINKSFIYISAVELCSRSGKCHVTSSTPSVIIYPFICIVNKIISPSGLCAYNNCDCYWHWQFFPEYGYCHDVYHVPSSSPSLILTHYLNQSWMWLYILFLVLLTKLLLPLIYVHIMIVTVTGIGNSPLSADITILCKYWDKCNDLYLILTIPRNY